MNRLGLKISCVVVSVVIWFQVASTTQTEQVVSLPLRIAGLQDGLTVAGSVLPRQVRVRLTASKLRLLAYRYFHRGDLGWVSLALSGRQPAADQQRYALSSADVRTPYRDPAPVVVSPDAVYLQIDRRLTRRLPVRLETAGDLRPDLGFVTPPWTLPDSVTVTGPERMLAGVAAIGTEALDLAGLKPGDRPQVALAAPGDHLELAPESVEVRFDIGNMLERTIANLTVTALVDAGQPPVLVSPPAVEVRVRGVDASVAALTQADLTVTVSASALGEGLHRVPVEVQAPGGIVVLERPVVDVIVGEMAARLLSGGAGREGAGD